MAAYDLRQLSSRDFEELTRDLLQAEWDVMLERFKVGPDQGVDLRFGKTIIQCKHYARSDYATLLSKLRRDELPKVRKLNPDRYVLVTSLELSPANKDVIADLFRPYVLSPGDVKGAGDIEGLLQRHPEVGRANFKLWLTSTEVLERVLHNAEECQTSFAAERVIRKLPVFVQNAAFPRAQKILDDTRVLVISGVPGIGKTTLAEMLLYAHLEQGYQPVVIHSDVREGKNRFSSLRPQVFYFDDFLGQTFLGENRLTGRVNGDLELVEFVEMIKASGKSRFILTTREHLLQNARGHSERLAHSALVDSRCLLEFGDYSRGQRGRILYNHLYFSDLAREHKEQILRDDFFLEILGHKHFNPRLIEWLSSASRLRNVPSSSYQGHVRALLANPQAIWSHAFNHQLSSTARNALLTLYSLGGTSERSEFEWLWKAFDEHCAARYHRASDPTSYRNALKDLDNAFVSYPRGQVTFLNPSVGEMVAREIADCPEYALDLVVAAGRFRQIINVFKLAKQEGCTGIHSALRNHPIGLMKSVTRLLRSPDIQWDEAMQGRRVGLPVDAAVERRLACIGQMAREFDHAPLRGLFESEVRGIAARYRVGEFDARDALSLVESFDEAPPLKEGSGASLQRELLNSILASEKAWWADDLSRLIEFSKEFPVWSKGDDDTLDRKIHQYEKEIDYEYDSCTSTGDYERFREELEALGECLGEPFTKVIQRIDAHLAETAPPDDPEHKYSGGSWRGASGIKDWMADTDTAIRDVFSSLVD